MKELTGQALIDRYYKTEKALIEDYSTCSISSNKPISLCKSV